MEYIVLGPGITSFELSLEEVLVRRIVLKDSTERAFWPEFLGSKMTFLLIMRELGCPLRWHCYAEIAVVMIFFLEVAQFGQPLTN